MKTLHRGPDLLELVPQNPTISGWLPAERQELCLVLFRARRETEVREPRARIPIRKAELEALTGRSERAALRAVFVCFTARREP